MHSKDLRATREDDSYIPHSDVGRAIWMENFINQIAQREDHFGIPANDFARCRDAVRAFVEALAKVRPKSQKTSVGVRRKNDARKAALRECRALAMRLKHDPNVNDSDRVSLHLHVDDTVLTRLQPPAAGPYIRVRGTLDGGHEILFRQTHSSGTAAKPKGVTHLLLFAAIGDGPLPVREARLIAGVTKQPHKVQLPANCDIEGMTITYYARWINRKGEMGPWSNPASMILSCAMGRIDQMESAHVFEAAHEAVVSRRRARMAA